MAGTSVDLASPFPYFGGKRTVAARVWDAMGNVKNYVEPFFGSGAVFLNRPHPHRIATINDADGYVCNFWRAIKADPQCVARLSADPVCENDLHARHSWLVARKGELVGRLEGDPDYYDAKISAWWCWGICCWIGGGWCSGDGPWNSVDGKFVKLPHLGDAGCGVNRQRPHLGAGRGVNRQRPHLGDWFQRLADRLAVARVCCGDWTRVCGQSVTFKHGMTGVFLDPPYAHSERDANLYAVETDCAPQVLEWCKANGDNPLLRIVLAGYDGEHNVLESLGWRVQAWKAQGGYGNRSNGSGRANAVRERLWLSPHCLGHEAMPLFSGAPPDRPRLEMVRG